jgi:hypothetical protein
MSGQMRISRRLMRMLLLSCAIVIVFTCALFVTYEAVTFKQSVVRQLEILGRAIARNSTAALAFDNPEDEDAVKIQAMIQENGPASVLKEISGLDADSEITQEVVRQYEALKA